MEVIKKCIICGNDDLEIFLRCADHFLTKEEFTIQECKNCGFRFTNPRPEENDLGKYYESEEYISHSNTQKGLLNSIYKKVRKYTLKRKFKLVSNYKKHGKVLDVGCATGEFLNVFKENDWEVYGVEPNENARNLAISNYNIDVVEEENLNDFGTEKFDVITMWHVLEHVAPLNIRMKELKRLLKPNGFLFVAVPNSNSYDAKIYKSYWAAYDLPRHHYHFTRKSINDLFRKYGFEMIDIKAMKFDAYYVSILSEKYKTGKSNYCYAIWNGFRSNLLAGIKNKEYSSLIYIYRSMNT